MNAIYWYEVTDENSPLEGEQFFVEGDYDKLTAHKVAREYFPNVKLTCYGRVSEEEAESMGYDTY